MSETNWDDSDENMIRMPYLDTSFVTTTKPDGAMVNGRTTSGELSLSFYVESMQAVEEVYEVIERDGGTVTAKKHGETKGKLFREVVARMNLTDEMIEALAKLLIDQLPHVQLAEQKDDDTE